LAIGEASYAIYLLHGYVLNLLFVDARALAVAGSPVFMIGLLSVVAGIVTVVALASFRYIEQPMIALGKRVSRRVVGQRSTLDEPTLQVAP
jgi:peptidoglycan/LPS O-acetylase OafA/YrhL